MTDAQLETTELNIDVDKLKQRTRDEAQMSEEDIERATTLLFAIKPGYQIRTRMATGKR